MEADPITHRTQIPQILRRAPHQGVHGGARLEQSLYQMRAYEAIRASNENRTTTIGFQKCRSEQSGCVSVPYTSNQVTQYPSKEK